MGLSHIPVVICHWVQGIHVGHVTGSFLSEGNHWEFRKGVFGEDGAKVSLFGVVGFFLFCSLSLLAALLLLIGVIGG